MNDTITKLKQEVIMKDDIQLELQKIQSQYNLLSKEYHIIQSNIEQKDLEIKRCREELYAYESNNMNNNLDNNNSMIRGLKDDIIRLESEIMKKSKSISQLEYDNTEVQIKISQRENEITHLKSEIMRLTNFEVKYNTLLNEKNEIENELLILRKQYQRIQNESEEISNRYNITEMELKRLKDEILKYNLVEEKVKSLLSEKEYLELELNKKSRALTQSDVELNDTKYILSQKESENQRYKDEINRISLLEERARSALTESKNTEEELRVSITKLQHTNHQLQVQADLLSSTNTENAELLKARRGVEAELATERALSSSKEHQIRLLQEEVEKLKNQIIQSSTSTSSNLSDR